MRTSLARRYWSKSALLVIATAAALSAPADGGNGGSPLMNPNATFRGKTVQEWLFIQNQWVIASGLGGQTDLPDTIKKMRFLPGEFGPGEFEFDIAVTPGTGFVLSPFFVFGEEYEDGSFDDPVALADLIDLILETTTIDVWLDGELVQSGAADELGAFAYGPTFFDEPIPYTEPQDRGGIFAVAALWGIGVGGVYHPLPPGEHTIEVVTDSDFFGLFEYTYNITVAE